MSFIDTLTRCHTMSRALLLARWRTRTVYEQRQTSRIGTHISQIEIASDEQTSVP